MKGEINLLPESAKNTRTAGLYRLRIRRVFLRTCIALGMVWIVLGASYWAIRSAGQTLAHNITVGERDTKSLEEYVMQVNRVMNSAETVVRLHPSSVSLLTGVFSVLPPEVKLLEARFDDENRALTLRATSSSRAAVVTLQRSLESLPGVTQLDAPLQNFATGADTEFSFTLHFEKPSV